MQVQLIWASLQQVTSGIIKRVYQWPIYVHIRSLAVTGGYAINVYTISLAVTSAHGILFHWSPVYVHISSLAVSMLLVILYVYFESQSMSILIQL